MGFRPLLFFIFLIPMALSGKIIETEHYDAAIEAVKQSSHRNVLVITDLDNTVLRPTTQLGSEAWEDHGIEDLQRKGISKHDAEIIENILWIAVQPRLKMVPVDPSIPGAIKELQQNKIPVLALTARFPAEVELTNKQLESLGIDLSVPWRSFKTPWLVAHSAFSDGVLYTSGFNKKSDVLFRFLDLHGLKPDYIIFIDNKMKHVQDISQAAEKRGIDYLGIRLNTTDDLYRNFNPAIAEVQWNALPQLLSDEEAEKALNRIQDRTSTPSSCPAQNP